MRQPVTLCLVLSQYPRDLNSSEIIVATCMSPRHGQSSELLLVYVQSKILHHKVSPIPIPKPSISPATLMRWTPIITPHSLAAAAPATVVQIIGIVAAIAKAVPP